jgi:hypothetical protein
LQKLKIVQRTVAAHDRRHCHLQLSSAGKKRYVIATLHGGTFGLKALSLLTNEEKSRLAGIFPATFQPTACSPQCLHSSLANTPEERARARGFLMEQLVAAGDHLSAPATLLDDDNECLALFSGPALTGVAEIEVLQDSSCRVAVARVSPGPDRFEKAAALLKAVIHHSLLELHTKKCIIPESQGIASILECLGLKSHDGQYTVCAEDVIPFMP